MITSPSTWRVTSPDQFIGPARDRAHLISRMVERAKENAAAPIKLLILGRPGIGKSELAEHFCREVNASKWATAKYNGTQFKIEDAEALSQSMRLTNLFGEYRVVRIEEVDRVPRVAQVRLLTLLDDMPPGNALVATSNCAATDLEDRFQRRFQVIELEPPSTDEVEHFLRDAFEVPRQAAIHIATLSCGNVGQALMDAEAALT